MKKLTLIILSMMLFAACKKESDDMATTSSGKEEMKNPQNTRTFRASFYTTVDVNPAIPPTACSGDLPGLANPGYFLHGTALHTGELISTLSRGQDVSCDLRFATGLLTTSVSGQLAANNGDLIYYTGNDVIDASRDLTATGTTGTINGTWTIAGGTGRFTGATGSFTITGPVDFVTGTFSFEALGTITY